MFGLFAGLFVEFSLQQSGRRVSGLKLSERLKAEPHHMDVAASYGRNFFVQVRDRADIGPFVTDDVDSHRKTAARTAVGIPDQFDEQKAEEQR